MLDISSLLAPIWAAISDLITGQLMQLITGLLGGILG